MMFHQISTINDHPYASIVARPTNKAKPTSGDDHYDSIIPADGTGLDIDGNSLTYVGTFSTSSGEEVEGSASAVCG